MARTLNTQIALAFAAVLAVGLLVVLAMTGDAGNRAVAAAKATCPKENASPGEATTEQLGDAIFCLVANERRKANLKHVDRNGALTRVASKHVEVMVDEDCLEHRCRGEKPLNDRIVNSGYPKPGERYEFGEITGCSLTPDAMVDAWMDSRVHRKRILARGYRDIGIGAAKGSPNVRGCDDGRRRGVYAVIFGSN